MVAAAGEPSRYAVAECGRTVHRSCAHARGRECRLPSRRSWRDGRCANRAERVLHSSAKRRAATAATELRVGVMGTSFFKSPKINPSGSNLEARAFGSAVGAGRGAAIGAQKDLGAALALNKSKFKPNQKSGAYPPGPKI